MANDEWKPTFSRWRHGGWYVTNMKHPSGAAGCVSRNYPDRKWRIVCDPRNFAHAPTFPSRDAAARAERDLATLDPKVLHFAVQLYDDVSAWLKTHPDVEANRDASARWAYALKTAERKAEFIRKILDTPADTPAYVTFEDIEQAAISYADIKAEILARNETIIAAALERHRARRARRDEAVRAEGAATPLI